MGLQWDSAWDDAFLTVDVDVGSMMIPDLNMRRASSISPDGSANLTWEV